MDAFYKGDPDEKIEIEPTYMVFSDH